MTTYNLPSLGTVEIDKKLIMKINISAEELFDRFPLETAELTYDCKNIIKLAANDKLEPQLKGRRQFEISKYFETIIGQLEPTGFDSEEVEEQQEAEELKGEELEEGEAEIKEDQKTYDEETGQVEGEIKIGDDTLDSKLVPIKIDEKIEIHYEHDGTASDKEITRSGKIEIINDSEKDRLWDIDLKFENQSQTSIDEDSIKIQELNPKATKEIEYDFEATVTPELEVEEFISTAGDPDVESYSLNINSDNEIFMRLKLTNKAQNDLEKVAAYKIVTEEFTNPQILGQSVGNAEIKDKDEKQVIFWQIDKLEQDEVATLDIRVQLYVSDKDVKLRTGKYAVKYIKPGAASTLEIKSFDAYTNNSYNIISTELDEEPNTYECKFIFENKSEYQIRLVNADVFKEDSDEKYIDIDPNDLPIIPGGSSWESNTWTYTSEDGEYPDFKTKVEFFTIADHQITTKIKMNYADVELAVAALEGTVGYDLEKLPSFKVTPFTLTGKVTNSGGANLNEVKLVELIQAEFLPPKPEEVEVFLNGNLLDAPSYSITIEPEDQDPTQEHTITILLENLKDTSDGPLTPGDEVEFKYPVTAFKPTRETLYKANATLSANTYPPGKPIEIKADPIEIEVIHIRKNLAKGKDIQALDTEGEYAITLSIKNMSEGEMTNYRLKEKIPAGLQLFDVSDEAKITEKDDAQILTWKFEEIAAGETIQVTYKIKPSSEDAKVSDAQKDE
ncbi:MAG: COG1470 family protein [Candidatus Heimdallarchaeota archaeon]